MSNPTKEFSPLPLAQARCFYHAEREAAVRCPACGRYFCRACVSEFEGRYMCASCLSTAVAPRSRPTEMWAGFRGPVRFALGLLLLWGSFYLVGKALFYVPSQFHADQQEIIPDGEEE